MARTFHSSNSAPQSELPSKKPRDSGSNSDSQRSLVAKVLSTNPATALANTTNFLASATKLAKATPLALLDRVAPLTTTAPQVTNLPLVTPLAPLPSRGYAEPLSNNLILMGLDKIDQLEMEPAYLPDQGIAPSEVCSQAPSTNIASQRSTPVPHPVERQAFTVTRREAPPPLMAGSTTPIPTRPLAPMSAHHRGRDMSIDPSPYNHVAIRGREMSVDTEMPAQDELTTISNIFQGQWLLFVNAKEANSYWLMRIALNQAISTQDTLTNLFGTQRMMEVLDGWLARDKLARMEQTLQIPPQPLAKPPAPWTQPQLAVAAQERPLSPYQARPSDSWSQS
ncbi:hypothetical protein PCASD_10369 [Puccinia coronata f. sp. avenae]|uniref:Uncharacterized protein n=1 Tax=Puccinia coronata f. sp. avenae TaxID=200324 RepID=A0A2N5UL12_9BASI|nr:hypothetical protein PCASD_10369 [Puccinia coronata f. sp. avenae]